MSSPVNLGARPDDPYVVLPDFLSDAEANHQVTTFLEALGLAQYAPDFGQHGIRTPDAVKALTEQDMQAWGLPQPVVKKILKFSTAIDNIVLPKQNRAVSERLQLPSTWT